MSRSFLVLISLVLLSLAPLHAQAPVQEETAPLQEQASRTLDNLKDTASRFWNQEIFTTEDKVYDSDGKLRTHRQGVTIGKIVLALVGVLIAFFIAKIASRTVMGNVTRRFSFDETRSAILQKIIYFLVLALAVFTILNWLHIPLTAFAFLGGALAIGVGFGVQTIMNNFISGLILLAEQRIKVGDTIEADGHLGRVMSLGMRCSRVRKGDGVDVLVPNSYLLEKNVINWTLSDPHHRFDFAVGVAYGSSTETTLELFKQALVAVDGVEKSPAPEVFFEEFGDNALIFRLYYWLDIRSADNRAVGSGIRMHVDRLCRDAGIEIAFPQRDIHLSTAKPLSIRLEGQSTN